MKKEIIPKPDEKGQHHEHPLNGAIDGKQKTLHTDAHREADKDMRRDPDLTAQGKNDDLDEGESARLGDNKNELV